LVGASAGDHLEFSITVPDDHREESLRGKTAAFKVDITKVEGRDIGEMDEAFFSALGGQITSGEELRARLREQLERDQRNEARRQAEFKVLDQLLETSTIEYPESLVEHEMDHIVENRLSALGSFGLDRYLSSVGKSREELREEERENARLRVLRGLTLNEVLTREGIEPTSDEVSFQFFQEMQSAQTMEQLQGIQRAMDNPDYQSVMYERAKRKRGLDFLVELATGVPPEQGAALASGVPAEGSGEDAGAVQDEAAGAETAQGST